MKSFLRVFILCLGLIATVSSLSSSAAETFFFEDPLIGKTAPDFTLETLKTGKQNLTQYRDGQLAIVFFWATWCPHCREQLKGFNKAAPEIEKKGIKLILVDIGEDKKVVAHHMEKMGLQQINVFLDENSKVAEAYSLIGVPTFYFIDKQGVIQDIAHELPDNYEELFKPMHQKEAE